MLVPMDRAPSTIPRVRILCRVSRRANKRTKQPDAPAAWSSALIRLPLQAPRRSAAHVSKSGRSSYLQCSKPEPVVCCMRAECLTCGLTGPMLVQRYAPRLHNRARKYFAALRHGFPEAVVQDRKFGQDPNRPFATQASDVSHAGRSGYS
jgi:hypothetical protein